MCRVYAQSSSFASSSASVSDSFCPDDVLLCLIPGLQSVFSRKLNLCFRKSDQIDLACIIESRGSCFCLRKKDGRNEEVFSHVLNLLSAQICMFSGSSFAS